MSWDNIWYNAHPLRWLLWPLSFLYQGLASIRKIYYQNFAQRRSKIPIIVVGNLSVGGVGKTPLVIAIAKKLTLCGLKVGIVSRGYKASITKFPHEITAADSAEEVGDEPLLLAQKTNCPVIIAPKRNMAVEYLEKNYFCDVIISDDGLQHYAMGRSIEIAVIDGSRGLGNGLCLPAGPLREQSGRLSSVDCIVVNEGLWPGAYGMRLKPGLLRQLMTDEELGAQDCPQPIAAIAGIGNPERFFTTLKDLNIDFLAYPFEDHYPFKAEDLKYSAASIVMTEKDAVKCKAFVSENMYVLPVEAELESSFWDVLLAHPSITRLVK